MLAATGNRGRIYRIKDDGTYADIAHLDASQATGFGDTAQGTYISTANSGKVFLLSHGTAAKGTYLSDVYDADFVSQWGRSEVDTGAGADARNFDLEARAGNVDNPERGWSDWKKVTPNVGALELAPARFVQWRAVLRPGADIASVGINYLPVNVAPVVDEIVVEPGARVNTAGMQLQQAQQITINFPASQNANVISFPQEPGREPLPAVKDKTAVTARWLAHDDNGDDLVFSIYYRGDGEQNWQLLKAKVTDRYYTFDASLLPDGPYRLKVIASDAPSHNSGEALTGDRLSDRFVIDTTPPTVSGMSAQMANGKIHVTLTATDAATPIAHAEYAVDAGPWQYVEPLGKISDSLTEQFDFEAPLNPPVPGAATPVNANEHVITVRVYDRYDNAVTAKAVVH